ncbi:hypothetical protein NBRC10513_006338 [Rhodotorula toruloides]|uniref:BY PROTMAP: gi/472580995/gb/EMS18756.1/ zinc finger, MYND-type domain containing protein [Rhodosporidium toruloides NP11] gi/647402721/emb/CDR48936.1/ RHTO0S21e02014g1_1 [Rhodosporidium toruloides] n=1 Tax=Rhodotorula toruloides TaxID=5286 RepID=A0A0K3CGL5_RHOTO|nr:hypothetical protein AAT19DRAFT_16317 [Rhodotorula toruloides]
MQAQIMGECLVCGTETKNRCSRCLEAGLDLFFCSPEHQKLVWFGHKLVCGENAFPFVLPLLSADELDVALRDLDKPMLDAFGSVTDVKVSALFSAKVCTGKSREEIVSAMRYASTTASPHAPVRDRSTQLTLIFARLACPVGFTRSPRDDLLSSWARHNTRLVNDGLLPIYMADASLEQTVLAHRFFCMLALPQVTAARSPSDKLVEDDIPSLCRDSVIRFARAHFGPAALAGHLTKRAASSAE